MYIHLITKINNLPAKRFTTMYFVALFAQSTAGPAWAARAAPQAAVDFF
jgi:hypothetical protein